MFSNGLVVFKLIFKLNKREVPTCHRKIIKIVMCVWPSPLPRRAQMRPASLFERPICMEIIKVHMRDLNVRPAPPRWVWHSCKTKSSNDFKINWCNQNQTILLQSSPKNRYCCSEKNCGNSFHDPLSHLEFPSTSDYFKIHHD